MTGGKERLAPRGLPVFEQRERVHGTHSRVGQRAHSCNRAAPPPRRAIVTAVCWLVYRGLRTIRASPATPIDTTTALLSMLFRTHKNRR